MHLVFDNLLIYSRIKGVIQIGAAFGEEIDAFQQRNIKNQIYIEPISEQILLIKDKIDKQKIDAKIYNIAISDFNGEANFYISKECTHSSSLLEFDSGAIKYGDTLQNSGTRTVKVKTLDSLVEDEYININKYNLLYVDAQGGEYNIVKGAEKTLKNIDFFFTEVNIIELYKGVVLFDKFNEYVKSLEFTLVGLDPLIGSHGSQKEALYINNKLFYSDLELQKYFLKNMI